MKAERETNPSQTLDPNPAQRIRRDLGLDGVGITRTQKGNTEYTEIDEGHAISARAESTHANHIQTQQQQSPPWSELFSQAGHLLVTLSKNSP